VNEAVESLHRDGLLTQTSLMVEEPALEEAVRIAKNNPALEVGLHLVVCTDSAGKYPRSPTIAGLRYALLPWTRKALREAIERQFAQFAALGLPCNYWDGHTHSHLHPVVFRCALQAAKKHGFRVMRLVQDETAPGIAPRILGMLSERAKPALQAAQMRFVSQSRGLAATGKVTTRYLLETLGTLRDGWSELYFHPGAEPESIEAGAVLEQMAKLEITTATARDLLAEL